MGNSECRIGTTDETDTNQKSNEADRAAFPNYPSRHFTHEPNKADEPKAINLKPEGDEHPTEAVSGTDETFWNTERSKVSDMAISSDKKRFISVGSNNLAIVWDFHTGKQLYIFKLTNEITCVAFLPCGWKFVTGDKNNNLILWDIQTQSCTFFKEGHQKYITSVAINKNPDVDGNIRIISGSADRKAIVWSLKGSVPERIIRDYPDSLFSRSFQFHEDYVECVALTDNYFATGSRDGKVGIYDDKGILLPYAKLNHQNKKIRDLVILENKDKTKNMPKVFTLSEDGWVTCWCLKNSVDDNCASREYTLVHDRDISIMVVLDGRWVVTGGSKKNDNVKTFIWDLEKLNDECEKLEKDNYLVSIRKRKPQCFGGTS